MKFYAKRENELMNCFSSFNISSIERDKNQKVDSLVFIASSFNSGYSRSQNIFQVKRICRPSVPDNQDYFQVFENDEELVEFLDDTNDVVENFEDQSHIPLPRDCINFEYVFTRDGQTKVPNLKE
jgi:hypothetical protein